MRCAANVVATHSGADRPILGAKERVIVVAMDSVVFTDFGRYFLPLLVSCALLRAQWLLPFAFVAAVFQSPAVVVVSLGTAKFGVTPFNVAALFIAIHLLWLVVRQRSIDLGSGRLRLGLLAWGVFTAISVIGAFFLPRLFAGLPVFLLADPNGFDYLLTPLRFSVVNLVQAINSMIMFMLFIYVLQLPNRTDLLKKCLWGLTFALVASMSVGVYQRLGWMGFVAQPNEFWASNPSYVQMWQTPFGPIQRVSFPFVEPSFASAWFAAIAGGLATLYCFGRVRQVFAGLGLIAAVLALLNTLGFTGLLAFVGFALMLGFAAILALLTNWQQRRGALLIRLSAALATVVVVGLIAAAWLENSVEKSNVSTVWSMFSEKLSDVTDRGVRARSNLQALAIARDSYGLGVGSGSNRASNYFLSLLTNTGLLGTLAFLLAVALPCIGLARSHKAADDPKVFVLGATACMLVCVAGGIPDQNWPPLWIVLLTVFCAYAQQHAATDIKCMGPQTAR